MCSLSTADNKAVSDVTGYKLNREMLLLVTTTFSYHPARINREAKQF